MEKLSRFLQVPSLILNCRVSTRHPKARGRARRDLCNSHLNHTSRGALPPSPCSERGTRPWHSARPEPRAEPRASPPAHGPAAAPAARPRPRAGAAHGRQEDAAAGRRGGHAAPRAQAGTGWGGCGSARTLGLATLLAGPWEGGRAQPGRFWDGRGTLAVREALGVMLGLRRAAAPENRPG